jgi:ABC-type nickel/cobalt efflux system permease component RcnA
MFGLSGGLIPCSAAIAVLALCLQLHQVWLGVGLVLCFSIGLAITLTTAGMIAAIGMRHVFRAAGRGLASLPNANPISPASS